MDKIVQIAFMDYVSKSSYQKINQTDIPCVLYKHVNSLIRQYIQEEQSKPIVRVINVGNDNNDGKKDTELSKKGWLW